MTFPDQFYTGPYELGVVGMGEDQGREIVLAAYVGQ